MVLVAGRTALDAEILALGAVDEFLRNLLKRLDCRWCQYRIYTGQAGRRGGIGAYPCERSG